MQCSIHSGQLPRCRQRPRPCNLCLQQTGGATSKAIRRLPFGPQTLVPNRRPSGLLGAATQGASNLAPVASDPETSEDPALPVLGRSGPVSGLPLVENPE